MQTQWTKYDLNFDGPITKWDEALPLGNGWFGALIWGDGTPIRFSLDRIDLWDLRSIPSWERPDYNYRTMRAWVNEGRIDDLRELYENTYTVAPGPTKIPAGRLEITLGPGSTVRRSTLHLRNALARVETTDGSVIESIVHAERPIGYLRVSTGRVDTPPHVRVAVPPFSAEHPSEQGDTLNARDLRRLGYPEASVHADENVRGFVQPGWGGYAFAVVVGIDRGMDGAWEIAWSISTTEEGKDPWDVAVKRVQSALRVGWRELFSTHADWWSAYWAKSTIFVPNATIDRQWRLETYKFGALARNDAPPISLQAVWTPDDGLIPPWKGDYHHDLNTQLSYWPCYSGNRLDEGLGFLNWLWKTRDEAYAYTKNFWELPGLNVPMTADVRGRQMGGWHQYTHSATVSAWLAQHFYLHWRYSQDRNFLVERCYPYLHDTCVFLEAVTERDARGKRFLPLSSSPEIHDNRLEAWMTPTTNYDLALIRWAFGAAAELAEELDRVEDRERWRRVLAEFPDFSYAPDGRLLVAPDEELKASHRHFSHLMAIHPLGLITWEDGDAGRRTIRSALDELDRLGPDWWCGYSYSWLANLAARAKDGERAERALEIFAHAFCTANSFHVNGDQTGSGFSKFTYRPFTLEGNFAAAAGVQEMLLQSYSGSLKIFPAVPTSWRDVSFTTLRAEGGFVVSASREGDASTEVNIVAEAGGTLRIQNPLQEGARFLELRIDGKRTSAARASDGLIVLSDLVPGTSVDIRAL